MLVLNTFYGRRRNREEPRLALTNDRRKTRALLPDAGNYCRPMLESGQLKAGEKMFDLGSGDGRIVIMAAQKYHADATGIELDNDLYILSGTRSASSDCRRRHALFMAIS